MSSDRERDTAQTIRRPARRWWRLRNGVLFFGGLFACWLVWTGYQMYRISRATPMGNTTSAGLMLEFAERAQPGGGRDPEAPNGWDILIEAILEYNDADVAASERLSALGDERGLSDWLRRQSRVQIHGAYSDVETPTEWHIEEGAEDRFDAVNALHREMAMALIQDAEARGVPDLLDELAATPRIVRGGYVSPLITTLLPNLGSIRSLARLEHAKSRLAISEQRWEDAIASIERTLALGRAAGTQPTTIDGLVGVAINAMAMEDARRMIAAGAPLAAITDLFDAVHRQWHMPTAERMIEVERLQVMDALDWMFSKEGYMLPAGGGAMGFGGGPGGGATLRNIPGLFLPRRSEYDEQVDRVFDELRQAIDEPLQDRGRLFNETYESVPTRFTLLHLLLPALGRATSSIDTVTTEHHGLMLWIAIERYRADVGSYPLTLTALVPEYIVEVPEDPMAPDRAFRYELLETPDADGRVFWLYSVGRDGEENRGTWAPSSEALRRNSAGTDHLINRRPDE